MTTNYVTKFQPEVKPQDWMKISIGGLVGAITLQDLKSYVSSSEGGNGGNGNSGNGNGYSISPEGTFFSKEQLEKGIEVKLLKDGVHVKEGVLWDIFADNSTESDLGTYIFSSEDTENSTVSVGVFPNYPYDKRVYMSFTAILNDSEVATKIIIPQLTNSSEV